METPENRPRPERAQSEQALLEPPLPHGGGLPPNLFANRPFLWLVLSMGVSQLGFWAFFVGVLGQASFQFGAGPLQMGILFSTFSVAFLLLTAPLGLVTDRWSPKWMLVAGQAVSIGAVMVALLGRSLPWLYVASAVDGMGAAAAIPARGSLTGLLVEEDSLVRANGMLNTASMLAVIIGPGIAGILWRDVGQDAVYEYIAAVLVLGGLLLLPIPDRRPQGAGEPSFFADLVEGFRVSWRDPELRTLVYLVGSTWFLLTVLVTLEPLFVKQVLHRGISTLGFMWSAHGVGAFVGALAVARYRSGSRRELILIGLSIVAGGIGYLLYVGTSAFGLAVAGNVVFGVGFAWYLSLTQALIQRVAAEDMRGRVTGVVGMLQEGTALVCSLAIVALGGAITAVQPYLVGSAVLFIATGVWGVRAGARVQGPWGKGSPSPAEAVEGDG